MKRAVNCFSFPALVFLLHCMTSSPLHADCTANGIWTWPNDSLAVNGRIIITGYALDREMIRDFAFQHPRLVGNEEEIPLLVEAVYESDFSLTQAVLVPSQSLQSGAEYRLEVDSMPQLYGRQPSYFFPNDSSTFRWTVTDRFDATPPKWLQGPGAIGAHIVHWGCGPGRYLVMEYALQEEQPHAFEVELVSVKESGKIQKFIVVPEKAGEESSDGKLRFSIGHGMCSGEFFMEENVGYRARFTAIDGSGNRTEYPQSCVLRYGEMLPSMETAMGTPCRFSQEECMDSTAGQSEAKTIIVD